VERDVLAGDPVEIAPLLLGKILRSGAVAARIVEVEAYRGAGDDASHARNGPTRRNSSMYAPAGALYVYLCYGVHHCANVVCWPKGVPGAVLLRAGEPLAGMAEMATRRRRVAPGDMTELCSGPGKLCEALGIDLDLDGADLVTGARDVELLDDGFVPGSVRSGPRIGLGDRRPASEPVGALAVLGPDEPARVEVAFRGICCEGSAASRDRAPVCAFGRAALVDIGRPCATIKSRLERGNPNREAPVLDRKVAVRVLRGARPATGRACGARWHQLPPGSVPRCRSLTSE